MAYGCKISTVASRAALNALLATVGATGSAGYIKLYSGGIPLTVASTASSGLLATLTLGSVPAWSSAVDDALGAKASLAVTAATALPTSSSTPGSLTNAVTHFRVTTSTGTAVLQGTAGTSGCDLNFNTTTITPASMVEVSALDVVLPIE
jgi:hypothetical protein